MCKKLIFLASFVLLLSLVGTSIGQQVDPSLVGWWKFDEGSGTTAADSSGKGNNGTLHGPVEWTDGHDGKALKFTGPFNFVRVANSPTLNPTDAITICAWINPSWTGNNRILQKSTEGNDDQYRLLKEWGDNMVFHLPGLSPDRLEFPGCPPAGVWTHLAAVYDGSRMIIYYNGSVAGQQASSGKMTTSTGPLFIGTKWSGAPAGDEFNGMLDDVRIYNRALSASEIIMLGGDPKAQAPAPADRAIHTYTWANLSWKAGCFAVSHNVYLGENLDDVKAGTGNTFQRNQTDNYFLIGFAGYPYPKGLVEGTTYYWRVDEVNDVHPDSPWKGDVWRFTVPPRTAWRPSPADNARLVDPNADLSWTPGWGAKMHTVYFGDNFNDVNNATGGQRQLATTYQLDTLQLDKTYYWRVDEFDGRTTTYKGNVWSFTTAGISVGGIVGEYYNNLSLLSPPVLTRIEPGINYSWGGDSPGPGVEAPLYSVRWTGVLNVPFPETYTFYANVEEAVRLWVDDQLLINNWMMHHMAIEYQGKIDLEVGQVPIVMEISNLHNGWGGNVMSAQLSWSNPSLPKEIVPQRAFMLPVWACRSKPSNGAVDVRQTPILKWSPGLYAASHQVYFSTDENAVRNATTASPEYKGAKDLGSESYDPGKLQWDTTYYWRVDEVNDLNPGSPWVGDVWSFKTANFFVVDDFEDYDDACNRIFYTWVDGLPYSADPDCGVAPSAGNNTRSSIGNPEAPFAEQIIVHRGSQAMPYSYDNSAAPFYSETERTFAVAQDWTQKGVKTLTIWFRGDLNNAAEPMYVVLNGSAVVSHSNPNAAQMAIWTEWTIDLQAFANQGVNLANVNKIAIGFGDRKNPKAGGSGTVYFDDIRLYPPPPTP